MRRLLIAGVLSAGLWSGAAVAQATPQDAFTAYRQAVLRDGGRGAGALVTSATAATYERARRAAVAGDGMALDGLPLVEALLALRLRAAVPAADLRTADGAGTVALAARHGLVGDGVAAVALRPAEVYGDNAMAEQTDVAGRPVGVWWRFLREGGVWRVDLRPNLEAGEALLRDRLRASGQTRADFLNTLARNGR
ncbi:hypothetical protein ACM64Y_02250 [Novispirillum sp. DQ9]|uniref:hypothetical protein n=1 Tax=Novispirillum sp. DQ9 TaxID=3398612 RepID=UPI003C7AB9F1